MKYKQSGFTLLEMLIYMGLSAIFLVSLSQVFVMIANVRLGAQALSMVQQDGQYLLSRLNYDISNSQTISTPAIGQTSNTLVTNSFTYSLNNGDLEITDSSGTEALNSSESKISNLQFLHLGTPPKDTIQVSFTLTSVAKSLSGEEVKNFKTTLGIK